MQADLVITGLGLVTPLGVGVEATWRSLLAGDFVTDVGRVDLERDAARSRVAQLGLIAAREAIGGRSRALADAAIVVGTSKGPVDAWLEDGAATDGCARSIDRGAKAGLSDLAVCPAIERSADAAFGLAGLADEIADDLALTESPSHRMTFSAACASGLHALARAALLLRAGDAERAIVIASESSLDPLWFGTFRNLGVLAPPGQPCRPLDAHRNGFVMSEAAAAIVLERRTASAGDLVLDRCEIASDATHLTGIDPTGQTVRSIVDRAASGEPIDFVHAHATATGNDVVELAAIRSSLGEGPAVYSHKGSMGHTLGASSLIAVVLNAMIHRHGTVPPMPTTRHPTDGLGTSPNAPIRRSLCLAAGFGGTLAAAALRTASPP